VALLWQIGVGLIETIPTAGLIGAPFLGLESYFYL
jgi:hypothetical protein